MALSNCMTVAAQAAMSTHHLVDLTAIALVQDLALTWAACTHVAASSTFASR